MLPGTPMEQVTRNESGKTEEVGVGMKCLYISHEHCWGWEALDRRGEGQCQAQKYEFI